jgi:hypothetical protein
MADRERVGVPDWAFEPDRIRMIQDSSESDGEERQSADFPCSAERCSRFGTGAFSPSERVRPDGGEAEDASANGFVRTLVRFAGSVNFSPFMLLSEMLPVSRLRQSVMVLTEANSDGRSIVERDSAHSGGTLEM